MKVLVCLMLILTACCADKLNEKVDAKAGAQIAASTEDEAEGTHRHYSSIAANIRNDPSIENAKVIAFAIDSLLNPNWVELDGPLSQNEVLKYIKVQRLNQYWLVSIDNQDFQMNRCKSLKAFFLTDELEVVYQHSFQGHKHDPGNLQIEDVNRDGSDEFWFHLNLPAASVNSGYSEATLCDFEVDTLLELFRFMPLQWDCTMTNQKKYDHVFKEHWYSDGFMRLKEDKWLTNYSNAHVLGEFQKETLISRKYTYTKIDL